MPPGVFNVVQGDARVGQALTRHPGVAKVSLTGEVGTGRKVMAQAAETLKHVTLELGGKSPLIVFADAHLDNAVSAALHGELLHAGRGLLERDPCVRARVDQGEPSSTGSSPARPSCVVGDPTDPDTHVGALISREHLDKVMGYIERGKAEGARLLCGGVRPDDPALANGNFVVPAIFDECRDDMTIVREEIFGPVMSVLSFADEDEVVARANATEFGLAAGVFTTRHPARPPGRRPARGGDDLDQQLQHHADRAARSAAPSSRASAARTASPPSSTTPS